MDRNRSLLGSRAVAFLEPLPLRLRILVGLAIAIVLLLPAEGRSEPFTVYWTSLAADEQGLVDQVAADIYAGEPGRRLKDYSRLNSASKQRYRARAVEILGVVDRPARARRRAREL